VLAVVLAQLTLGRHARWLLAGLAIVLAAASYQRNALYQSSLAVWQDAAAKRPGNARAHVAVGVLEEQAGRSAEAEAAYKRALQVEPAKAEAATNLGQVLRRAGRYDEAEATLRAVIDRLEGRERAIALNNLADVILVRPGREAEAIERLQEASLLAPDQTGVHFNLARLLARVGRDSESLPHFEMALRERADDVALRRSYAAALMATGDAAKAIPEFETVIRLQPESAGNLNDLGVAQALAGRHAEARTTFARALALDPAYQQARENLARVDRELND
jgi:Flp pilus assembly protein TadD